MILSMFLFGVYVMVLIFDTYSIEHQMLTALILVFLLITYACTALRNPGIRTSDDFVDFEFIEKNKNKFCFQCGIIKTPTLLHCSSCDVCIEGLDHRNLIIRLILS